MLAYAAGDAQAFERLYLKHKGGLYRYFVRQLSDMTLAEDLYQETWSRVIKAAQSYQQCQVYHLVVPDSPQPAD